MDAAIKFTVNDKKVTVKSDPDRSLLDVLREDLGLTGTKYGCGEGQCGACTVLMNGECVLSCMSPVSGAAGKSITTIEGLGPGDSLHPVQKAFLAEDASQCGYCTPGMILTAVALLEKKPDPSDREIAEWMDGNICRCCGYPKITAAIKRAAKAKAEVITS